MKIPVIDRPGRTDKSATEATDAVFKNCHPSLAAIRIKGETFGWADVQAQLTAATGLVINCHLEHLSSSVFHV